MGYGCNYIIWQNSCYSNHTSVEDGSKISSTSNGQNHTSEADYASVMNVISGVKSSAHEISSLDSNSVPKMGVHISPDLEINLERVCRWIFFYQFIFS